MVPGARHNDGNRLGGILGRPDPMGPSCNHDDINLEMQQLGDKLRDPIEFLLRITVLDGDVLSFDITTFAQSQLISLESGGLTSSIGLPR